MFSIICPVYNAKRFLESTINSLLEQEYDNWELILVDDGSTDGSGALCDVFSFKDKRISVVHQSNYGQSKARLVGIEKACGEYILFLDSDDFLASTILNVLNKEIMKTSPDAILFDAKKKKDKKLLPIYSLSEKKVLVEKQSILIECFGIRTAGYFWTYCFKKDLFNISESVKSKFSNIKYSEDVYLIYQIIKNNVNSLSILPESLYIYFINNDSITHNQTIAKVRDRFNVFNDVYEDLYVNFKIYPNMITKSNIGWNYLSFLIRAAKEYDFAKFKETAKKIRNSYVFKRLNKFKKDKHSSLIQFLFQIRMYKTLYIIIRKY